MASTANRWDVTVHLCDLAGAHPNIGEAKAWPVWPGDKQVTSEMIVGDMIEGESSVPTMKAGRLHRDDRFTILFQFSVMSQKHSFEDAMGRLFELLAIFEDICADDSTLESFPGVVSAVVSTNRQWPVSTPEGAIARGELTVDVHARLT